MGNKHTTTTTPILDGIITTLIAVDVLNKHTTRKRPTIRRTTTTRQVYDQKTRKIITLTTTTETQTQEL